MERADTQWKEPREENMLFEAKQRTRTTPKKPGESEFEFYRALS
jgi:hypothetical protein